MRFHIQAKGKRAGDMVRCPARFFCTLVTAEGHHAHHGNFVYDRDANNWNRIRNVIASGGKDPLKESQDAMVALENEQSLSDETVQAVMERESANQMGGIVHVLPRKVLAELAEKRHRARVQKRRYAEQDAEQTRQAAAKSQKPVDLRNMSEDQRHAVLAGASQSRDVNVRKTVAMNPMTDAVTLDRMSYDREWQVRKRVAMNPKITGDTMLRLAKDGEPDVREAVALNPNVTDDVLQRLAADSQYDIASEAREALNERGVEVVTPEDMKRYYV